MRMTNTEALKLPTETKFHLIENWGYDGLSWTECKDECELIKKIRESGALDIYVILGRELIIKKRYMKKARYWDKKKPTEIPELEIIITGND